MSEIFFHTNSLLAKEIRAYGWFWMMDLSEEWIKAAVDELESARELLKFPHLTNIVSFHCHQVIDKSFK